MTPLDSIADPKVRIERETVPLLRKSNEKEHRGFGQSMFINVFVALLESSVIVYSGLMVCELKPSILATGFRFVLA